MVRHAAVRLALLLAIGLATAPGSALAEEPARSVLNVNYNMDEIGPPDAGSNSLDLYLPPGEGSAGLIPVVIWVHGGGWRRGDKSNGIADKARLFNDLGYILVSVNYRLSPDNSGKSSSGPYDPARVRAPDHVADLAEAIGWLSRKVASYGGDPDRLILAGHSAGAHLVSLAGTSPAWVKGRGVSPKQIVGVVELDTETFDVASQADASNPFNPDDRLAMIWNAFGTPEEEALEPRWGASSPMTYADPADPPFLLVTESAKPLRMAVTREFATALGQDPDSTVIGVPLGHGEINSMLGSPDDPTVETAAVSRFVQDSVAAARPAGVKITRRPSKKVIVRVRHHRRGKHAKVRRKVTFKFKGTGRSSGFQCRIDRKSFRKCHSPRTYRLGPGKHTFRVRALYPSGRPGETRKVNFRIIARRSRG
jgi:acetyl esterase/lipase